MYIKGIPQSLGKPIIEPSPVNILKKAYYKAQYLKLRLQSRLTSAKTTDKVFISSFKAHNTDKLLADVDHPVNPFTKPFELLMLDKQIGFDSIYLDDPATGSRLKEIYKVYNPLFKLVKEHMSYNHVLVDNLLKVQEFTKSKGLAFNGLADFLLTRLAENQATYYLYSLFLKETSYRKILTYCYYDNRVMALNRAARDLNIETVEYQHSQQSDDHFAYSAWQHNVTGAAHHFPATFWGWRQSDKLRVTQNFQSVVPKSKAILGGNVFLGILAKRFVVEERKDKGILIALQGMWIPDYIEKAIADNPSYTWYFRLHPRYPADKEKLERLKQQFPDRIETDLANRLSLYELFNKVSFSITAFSGTALEAQAFGVQNIIFSEDGYKAYQSYIEEEAFLYVQNTNELNEILSKDDLTAKAHDNMLIDIKQIENNIIKCFGHDQN